MKVFRVAVVVLLAVIALELGGWRQITETWHDASRTVRNVGVANEEMPMAPASGARGGIDSLYQKDIDAALDDQVRRAASAAGLGTQR